MARASRVDWFNLIEIDGPFLDPDILRAVFPQGVGNWLSGDPARRRLVLDAFEEWTNQGYPIALQRAWFDIVFGDGLRYPSARFLQGPAVPDALRVRPPEQPGVLLAPDAVLNDAAGKPLLFVRMTRPSEKPRSRARDGAWGGSPVEAMVELLRQIGPANDLRLGLVTNGREWSLVHVAPGVTRSVITWDAALWREEPLAFDAFVALLDEDRFTGVPDEETLSALFRRSQDAPKQVTEQLGTQVRQAVEILVSAVDRAYRERDNELLQGVQPAEVYEAAVSVMMRLIVLFYAEERGLLPADVAYQETYAVGGILDWLDGLSQRFGDDEVLSRRFDAWPRLLATFRAVHGGIEHNELRLPAYGGTLFDPDRFPFLEGRAAGSRWREGAAQPIRVDNQTVRYLLSALQRLEGSGNDGARRLSFRALDVEQIGHVYERLLDHTALAAAEPTLGIAAVGGEEPEIPLSLLEAGLAKGEQALFDVIQAATGKKKQEATLRKRVCKPLEPDLMRRLPEACNNDPALRARVEPFATLLRIDRAGRPVVILAGSLYVTTGQDRRSSGAHYTPRALTEEIVKHALDPLVFDGPAEGKPEAEWRRKPARALLELRVCDPAMGSGGFLVQACRYIADHLVASWDEAESRYGRRVVTPFGDLDTGDPAVLPIPADPDERLARARRAVVDHCLFGVDKNPLAVEMAKLSLWLITLQKDRPFTFLDHALRRGDSLLGISGLKQFTHWSLTSESVPIEQASFSLTTSNAVRRALRLRERIAATPVEKASDAEEKAALLSEARAATELASLGADLLIGAQLIPESGNRRAQSTALLLRYQMALLAAEERPNLTAVGKAPSLAALSDLRQEAAVRLEGYTSFHWPLEFPEVFTDERGGFDAFVGNPPFMGGSKITGALGVPYRNYLVEHIAVGARGYADLVAYFLLRMFSLLRRNGMLGMLATNSIAQGDSREVGLDKIVAEGAAITRAFPSLPWPGTANLEVAWLWIFKGQWEGKVTLNGQQVPKLTPMLTIPGRIEGQPKLLRSNSGLSFKGTEVNGAGFVLTPKAATELFEDDPRNKEVIFPYLNGEDLNSRPDLSPSRWVINFHDWPVERAAAYPDCFEIVRRLVKPDRDKNNRAIYRQKWWQFAERRPGLYAAIARLDSVVVISRVSTYHAPVLVSPKQVFSDRLVVFAINSPNEYALLASNIHEQWVRRPGATTHETRGTYFPTQSYETFPYPMNMEVIEDGDELLSAVKLGLNFQNIGLTQLYNELHSPLRTEEFLQRIRLRIEANDYMVARAYGWEDLNLGHGFHETKQGVRFTINEAARREVLDRLLELNHQRYAEEVAQGLHPEAGGKKRGERRGQPALMGLGE